MVDSKAFHCRSEVRQEQKAVNSAFISATVHLDLNIGKSRYNLSTVLQCFCLYDIYSCKPATDDMQYP